MDRPDTLAPMPRRLAVLVALVAVIAQLTALRSVFIWDDVLLLQQTDLYTNPARWAESVTVPLGRETFYWRPAATTSWRSPTCCARATSSFRAAMRRANGRPSWPSARAR